VHADNPNGERVYITSLTSGDFFGENGFFTGAPRTASVEALYTAQIFVIAQEPYAKAAADNARADATLLAFYEERVVDAVLATSQVFGLLPHSSRRARIERFRLRTFVAGSMALREGETSDDIYVIKNGDAEVFNADNGTRTSLSTLGPGTLFGEVAALRGIPRTASIIAKSDLTTLVLSKRDFLAVVDERPAERKQVMDVIASRVRGKPRQAPGTLKG
jgi:CRP-like cAMP-binding protein